MRGPRLAPCAERKRGSVLLPHLALQENEKHDDAFPIQALLSPYTTGPFPWSIGWKATWLLVMTFGITALLWMTHFVLKWCERCCGRTSANSATHVDVQQWAHQHSACRLV